MVYKKCIVYMLKLKDSIVTKDNFQPKVMPKFGSRDPT
jgi:hypothetical protein